jgi:hypothetical protein
MRITLKSFALDLLAGFTAVCALIAATVTVATRSLDQAGHIRVIHEGYDGSEGLDAQLAKNVEGLLRSPASRL